MISKIAIPLMGISVLLLIVTIPQASAALIAGQDEATIGSMELRALVPLPQGCPDIDYIFTGTGSGNLGQTNFQDADFIVTVWGNTCNVMEIFAPNIFTNRALMAKVEVIGIGTAMVTEETGVFTNDPNDAVGWSEFIGDDLQIDIYDLFGVPNNGYVLTTNFGPVFDATPFGFQVTVSTDAGIFNVQDIRDGSFESQLKAAIGGEISPMSTSALLLAGTQGMMSWMIPLVVAVAGFGLVISRKL